MNINQDILIAQQAAKPTAAFRELIAQTRNTLKLQFFVDLSPENFIHYWTSFIEQLLNYAWNYYALDQHQLCLIAIGGFGRGELLPASDIDLLILVTNVDDDITNNIITNFVQFCWDIGLDISHSVRNHEQCGELAQQDISIATAMMESRLLNGPETLFSAFEEMMAAETIWPSKTFFKYKLLEQQQRHAKYHATANNLEPNIKNSPGGLRDIHLIAWIAKRHFNVKNLKELITKNFLTGHEYERLIQSQRTLWQIRCALHFLTGRCEDRLLFDYQISVAKQLGYHDKPHQLAIEQFMQSYYRTVQEISTLCDMLLQLLQDTILPSDTATLKYLTANFQVTNQLLEIRYNKIFLTHPAALLEIFLLFAQSPSIKGIGAKTIRALKQYSYLINDKFRNKLYHRDLFIAIIASPQRVTDSLQLMNRYGILGSYLLAFGEIVGRMQYDLFHAYTVDQHILFVIRNLEHFGDKQYSQEFPLCSKIMQAIGKPELAYLAALFHDIAKGTGQDHSNLGAVLAKEFCLHHGLSLADSQLVSWLVQEHLLMSSTSQRQDIYDPDVIEEFSRKVKNQIQLDYLYMLTVADIRGTNPKLWTGWKDTLLKDLYYSTSNALSQKPRAQVEIIRIKKINALALLQKNNCSENEALSVWRQLGNNYFFNTTTTEIAWHTRGILQHHNHPIPMVLITNNDSSTSIFIYTPDRDNLFAHVVAILDFLCLNIIEARIITSKNEYSLDSFNVVNSEGRAITDDYTLSTIKNTITELLQKPKFPVSKRRAARHLQHFNLPTQVNFTQEQKKERTILELISLDRPSLLAKVGKVFVEFNIMVHNAKIVTLGERVEDIFYISGRDLQPIVDERVHGKIRERLIQELKM